MVECGHLEDHHQLFLFFLVRHNAAEEIVGIWVWGVFEGVGMAYFFVYFPSTISIFCFCSLRLLLLLSKRTVTKFKH